MKVLDFEAALPLLKKALETPDLSAHQQASIWLDIALTEQDIAALDRAFPPPKRKRSLEML